MADPAPSAPLPDAAPERRVSPADQMAALTGEPVELSQPEADEPAEDRDVTQDRQIESLSKTAPFERCAGRCALVSMIPRNRAQSPTQSQLGRSAGFAPCPERTLRASSKPDRQSRRTRRRHASAGSPKPPPAPPPRKPRTIRTRPREAPRARRRSTGRRWSPQP